MRLPKVCSSYGKCKLISSCAMSVNILLTKANNMVGQVQIKRQNKETELHCSYHEPKTSHGAKLNITGQGMLQNDQSLAIF